MKKCKQIKPKLALSVGQDLDKPEELEVQRHVVQCPGCRETLHRLQKSYAVLQDVSETQDEVAGQTLWSQIRMQLPAQLIRLPHRNYLGWLPTGTLVAACLAMVIFASSTPVFELELNEPSISDLMWSIPSQEIDIKQVSQERFPSHLDRSEGWRMLSRRSLQQPIVPVSYDSKSFRSF